MIRRYWDNLWGGQRGAMLFLAGSCLLLATVLVGRYVIVAPYLQRQQNLLASGQAVLGPGSSLSASEVITRGQRDLQNFRARFPARREFVKVLGAIYGAADASAVALRSISYKEDKSSDGFLVVPVTCQVAGSYLHAKQFLAALQSVPEMIVVDSIGIKQGKEEGVDATLDLNIYFRPEGR